MRDIPLRTEYQKHTIGQASCIQYPYFGLVILRYAAVSARDFYMD